MTWLQQYSKKSTFQNISHLNAPGSKFDLDVNLGSSFEQIWQAPHPECYIPSPKVIGLLVLEKIFKGFLPYNGRGGHLGHVTRIIWTNSRSHVLRSLNMKFECKWPSGFRGKDVWKCLRTDGRRCDWYTISSPMSFRLRWANKGTMRTLIAHLSSRLTRDVKINSL